MAHIAAVLPQLKNTSAATHDHASADDGDFAAVLASLTPKTDVQDAKPHVAQTHHVEPKPDESARAIQKIAPKIVPPVAMPVRKGDAKMPLQLKSHVPDKPDPNLPQPSEDAEDEGVPVIAPVRPPVQAQARLIDKAAPEIDAHAGLPIPKAAPPAKDAPAVASHAKLPVSKVAQPAVPAQDEPDAASNESVPVRKAAPGQDMSRPAATKVAQDVVDKIVAEAKTPATVVDVSKLVPPKPADKATGKPEPKVQAAVARAQVNVVVIDKAPPPAPPVVDKDAPQPKIDTQVQPRTERAASEPEAAAPQAPAAQPNAPAPQPAANAVAIVATHPQTASAPQIATAAMQAPAAPEPQIRQPNVAALAAEIAAKSGQGSKMFEIRLDPPELGRVDVHLSVSHDGKAEATLYADRPETVALLRGDSQNLERALKDAGLNVSNSSLNFSLKGEQRQGDGGGASSAHTRNLSHAVVARSEAVNASLANLTYASADGRLDIRV